MTGPGVEKPRYKDLDRLGDAFVNVDDKIDELKGELDAIEQKIILKMKELNMGRYRFGSDDKPFEIIIKEGVVHAKVKELKVKDGQARRKLDQL